MSFSISYQTRAIAEYENAVQWYREHSEHAAVNFEIAVKEKIELLRVNPHGYKKTYKQFHEASLKKYPYSLIYMIDDRNKRVVISSVFHHKRNPRIKYPS